MPVKKESNAELDLDWRCRDGSSLVASLQPKPDPQKTGNYRKAKVSTTVSIPTAKATGNAPKYLPPHLRNRQESENKEEDDESECNSDTEKHSVISDQFSDSVDETSVKKIRIHWRGRRWTRDIECIGVQVDSQITRYSKLDDKCVRKSNSGRETTQTGCISDFAFAEVARLLKTPEIELELFAVDVPPFIQGEPRESYFNAMEKTFNLENVTRVNAKRVRLIGLTISEMEAVLKWVSVENLVVIRVYSGKNSIDERGAIVIQNMLSIFPQLQVGSFHMIVSNPLGVAKTFDEIYSDRLVKTPIILKGLDEEPKFNMKITSCDIQVRRESKKKKVTQI